MKLIMENWRSFLKEQSDEDCPEFSFYLDGKSDKMRRYGGEDDSGLPGKPLTDDEINLLYRDDECGKAARDDLHAWIDYHYQRAIQSSETDKDGNPILYPMMPDFSPKLDASKEQKQRNFNVFSYFKKKFDKYMNSYNKKWKMQPQKKQPQVSLPGKLRVANLTGRPVLAIVNMVGADPNREYIEGLGPGVGLIEYLPQGDPRVGETRSSEIRSKDAYAGSSGGGNMPIANIDYDLPYGQYKLEVIFGTINGPKKRYQISGGEFTLNESNPRKQLSLLEAKGDEVWRESYRETTTVERSLKLFVENASDVGIRLKLLEESAYRPEYSGYLKNLAKKQPRDSGDDGPTISSNPTYYGQYEGLIIPPFGNSEQQNPTLYVDPEIALPGSGVHQGNRAVFLLRHNVEIPAPENEANILLQVEFMSKPNEEGEVSPKEHLLVLPSLSNQQDFHALYVNSPGGQATATSDGSGEITWKRPKRNMVRVLDSDLAERLVMAQHWDSI